MMKGKKPVLFTIGHSTRLIEEFIALLKEYGVKQLVDVRTIPKSRHNPQFNEDALRESLRAARIGYRHATGLGGLRHTKKDSVNVGWKNASFRGYADYMMTDAFTVALSDLIARAEKKPTAIMCAEAVPWRCHRSMIADALVKKKWEVRHITSRTSAHAHKLTSFARTKRGVLYYPKSD